MQYPWEVFPDKFLERLKEIIPAENLEAVLSSFTKRHPSTFRANTLKISSAELKANLEKENILVLEVPWYKDAFILQNVPQKILAETKWYKEGYLYIQSLSSMIPPLVLNPQVEERILDITAAPGSKTTQMAAMMRNTGEILANDKSHIRLFKLKANLALQGVTNTQVTQLPGEIVWKKIPEFFDKTLVDVPCSMEGRFYTEDPKSYRDWSTTKIKYLEEMQKFILRSAIGATRPGGTIIYSTCTLSVEENEGVIDWILKKEKDAIDIEPIDIPELAHMQGLTHWKQKSFDKRLSHTARIMPSSKMEGFYIAKIKKLRPTTTI